MCPYKAFREVIPKWMEPFFKLNEEHFAFHLHYKHFGTFANRKCEDVSYPQNPKMCDPILVTLLKMWPHYSQSSCENGTPSNGRCTLASYSMYKKVPPPGGGGVNKTRSPSLASIQRPGHWANNCKMAYFPAAAKACHADCLVKRSSVSQYIG